MMAVPATTAFEFGLGTDAAEWTGKERNDDWEFDGEGIQRRSRTTTAGFRAASRAASRSTAK